VQQSTQEEELLGLCYLFPRTYYVLVYFYTSTSLCLGRGATIYTRRGAAWTLLPISSYILCACLFLY